MTYTYMKMFWSTVYQVLDEDRIIATNLEERDAVLIVKALESYEGK